jgi:mycothiol synthase
MAYTFRAPTLDDLPAVAAVVREAELADYGEAEDRTEELQVGFGFVDAERDAWLVESGDGQVVGAGLVRVRHPTQLRGFAAVSPAHTGRGIGTDLLARIETRARELAEQAPKGETVSLGQDVAPANEAARTLLERHGYALVRHFWKMAIDLDGEPSEPAWPEGISVSTMAPGEERAIFDASEDAFQDHWGFVPHDYDEWRAWTVERESFDPSLWLIARDEDEIAGVSMCYAAPDAGWVGVLGVRRPWRRQGLGLALLLESLRALRRHGMTRAALHVDASNPTGATHLYERAGMHVVNQSDLYKKELR